MPKTNKFRLGARIATAMAARRSDKTLPFRMRFPFAISAWLKHPILAFTGY